jgi:dolichol-phosphate mannosyltransferase
VTDDRGSPLADLGAGALVCIPTYNERENIGVVVPAVRAALPQAHILVVDDRSPDGTGALADGMAAADPAVHVLHRTNREGLGRAYLAAFRWALQRDYDLVFEFDADLSHDPTYLPRFVARLRADADVVVGSRRIPGGGVRNWSLSRRLISAGGSLYARTVLGVPVRDLTGGFNGFRRAVLAAIDLDSIRTSGYGFQIELKVRALRRGFRVVELPIIFTDRVAGTSKMSARIALEALLLVPRLRRESSAP